MFKRKTNGFVKIEDSLITELPYDEIIKKENWDGKWSYIFKKNRVESLRAPSYGFYQSV